jgi:osmoprotectant transport system substrate-binding protein
MFYRTDMKLDPFQRYMAYHSRRDLLRGTGAIAGSTSIITLSGCTSLTGGSSNSVTVSSKRFAEQEILGYMAIEALNAKDSVSANDETGLGGTLQNFQAIDNQQVDLYWEYTGTAWYTIPPEHEETINDPEELYEQVKQEFREEHNLRFLDRAPLNNAFVLMANPDWVEETGVRSLTDFAEYVNAGNTDFDLALTAEFLDRSDGWEGVANHYGFSEQLGAIESNINQVGIGLSYQIVGQNEAQVGLGFNTNPNIPRYDLAVLDDDQAFFPVYNPAPLVHSDTLEASPGIEEALNPIVPDLTTAKIRELNKRVSIDEEDAQDVANDYLSSNDLI